MDMNTNINVLHHQLQQRLSLSERIQPTQWSYNNKLISSPMVRISTLPFRLLCVEYGADIVYSEELIAQKLSKCKRVVNDKLDTIEYYLNNNNNNNNNTNTTATTDKHPVLSTYEYEPLVVQLGTSNGNDALQAANVVLNDCCAIDINMGCPKKFSTIGNMGSALLTNIDAIDDIIRTLKHNINKPVTCKIRLLQDNKKTIDLIQHIQSLGVSGIGVHSRMKDDRPYHQALYSRFQYIYDVCNTTECPLLYNGDIFDYNDIDNIQQATGCNSMLIARGSMWNPSIFHYKCNKQTMLSLYDITKHYIDVALQYNNLYQNTKYVVCEILKPHTSKTNQFTQINTAKSYIELLKVHEQLQYMNVCTQSYKSPTVSWQPRPTQNNNNDKHKIVHDNDAKITEEQLYKKQKLDTGTTS